MISKPTGKQKPTAAELAILGVLWKSGAATVKQVHQAMQAERPEMGYANVLRQMQIMHGKGLLTRDESRRSHVYAPTEQQGTLQTSLLKEMIQRVFAGSGKALVMAALKHHVSAEERDEIEKFLHGDEP